MVNTPHFDLDIDSTLGGDNASDYVIPSQKAIKDYVDNNTGSTVDQTYDPTSQAAQSGVAIAGAGFLTSASLTNYVTTNTEQTITAKKTFNTRVNFLGTGDANAIYLSTDTRIDVHGTSNTVLGFANGTFLINNAAYNLKLRGKQTRPVYNSDTNYIALLSDVPTDTGDLTNNAGYIKGITSSDVTTALGYTPYDSSNPNGYTSNTGTVTSVNNVSPSSGNVTLTASDIGAQPAGNYVTTDTAQTITANKTISNATLEFNGTSTIHCNSANNLHTLTDFDFRGRGSTDYNTPRTIANNETNISITKFGNTTRTDIIIDGNTVYDGSTGFIPDDRISSNIARTSAIPTTISDLTDDTSTYPVDKADTLTGLTASVTELNYVDGVTSAIQTQLDGKADATLSNVSSIDSNSAVQTALDGKVAKIGDTMSGDLDFQFADLDLSSTISANTYKGIGLLDTNGDRIGRLECFQKTNGDYGIAIGSKYGTSYPKIELDVNSQGVARCSFPNTTCADGQFVASTSTLKNSVSWTGDGGQAMSLSSYLPNDGQTYTVWVYGQVQTTATSGKFCRVGLNSDIQGYTTVCCAVARSNASYWADGCAVMIVGSGRYLQQYTTTSANAGGTITVVAIGYRRLGTNS